MALIANVALTDTFDIWRTRTNQLAIQSNAYEGNILDLYNRGNNSPSYAFANNIGVQANAFASATIAGANALTSSTIAGANAAIGLGANSYANVVWARANVRMDLGGIQANAFASATIAGANTAVGDGANAYARSINSVSGTGFIATIDGANTAVGGGANAFSRATIAGANAAVGLGANSYANVVWARANARMDVVGSQANSFSTTAVTNEATLARNAVNLTSGNVPSARMSGSYTGITGVGTLTAGTWNATTIAVANGGTGGTTQLAARSGLGLGTISTQASSAVSITGGSITGITDITLADGGTGASLTGVAGGIVWSTSGTMAISAAGVSGQILTSGGTAAPYWTPQASLTVGYATSAGTATNATQLGGVAAASYLLSSTASSTYLPLSGGTMTGYISNATSSTLVLGQAGGLTRGHLYNDTSGFGLLTSGGGWALRVNYGTSDIQIPGALLVNGDITAFASSDRNLKDNIVPINDALNKIKQITGVMFDWKDEEVSRRADKLRHDTGVIAQDVEAVLPEVVTTRQDGYKAVRYEKLAGLIIQSIKELSDKVENLQNEIESLKK